MASVENKLLLTILQCPLVLHSNCVYAHVFQIIQSSTVFPSMMQSLELGYDVPELAKDGSTSAVLQQEAMGGGRCRD